MAECTCIRNCPACSIVEFDFPLKFSSQRLNYEIITENPSKPALNVSTTHYNDHELISRNEIHFYRDIDLGEKERVELLLSNDKIHAYFYTTETRYNYDTWAMLFHDNIAI